MMMLLTSGKLSIALLSTGDSCAAALGILKAKPSHRRLMVSISAMWRKKVERAEREEETLTMKRKE
jgi:hypothetical protein